MTAITDSLHVKGAYARLGMFCMLMFVAGFDTAAIEKEAGRIGTACRKGMDIWMKHYHTDGHFKELYSRGETLVIAKRNT